MLGSTIWYCVGFLGDVKDMALSAVDEDTKKRLMAIPHYEGSRLVGDIMH
jgi:hypothetical protein